MDSNKQQILIVTSEFPPQPGGIGNHAYNLANQLKAHHFGVTVIADARSSSGDEERIFDEALSFNVSRVWVSKLRIIMYVKRLMLLNKALKRHQVVFASGKFSLWSVALFSLFYRRKYFAVVHGTEVNFKSLILKAAINGALWRLKTIIAVSGYTKSLLKGPFHKKTMIIPNGYDATKWNKTNSSELKIKGSPKLITVGNVTERKGQIHVIRHLPRLIKKYPEVHYHCVGIPTEMESCIQEANILGVQKHITFHGKVSQEDLLKLVGSSDIFVMLSGETKTGDVEGFGIAIIEANALGVPAIGAMGSGIEDAILSKKSGLLIKGNDTKAFLNAVETILNNKQTFSKQASIWADKHRWEHIVKQYIDLIRSID
ncbi:glycosyltransferase family 4 protein [Seonamhaeicola maritimus]|uniref:Glycosyltransferase family 4 protein n=1 Tax=Seonamhaeicola maritimus TaxID=2591822 RepID=A0A5C7GKK5_9FLAO|nr:glycosyltransferase family 4 protein [Seonamhaeicola maritimus]TXG38878.1 glycosyltransferase family 4 protein [Seonamhaeicola maritimus]